jgi:hypothetical protein
MGGRERREPSVISHFVVDCWRESKPELMDEAPPESPTRQSSAAEDRRSLERREERESETKRSKEHEMGIRSAQKALPRGSCSSARGISQHPCCGFPHCLLSDWCQSGSDLDRHGGCWLAPFTGASGTVRADARPVDLPRC